MEGDNKLTRNQKKKQKAKARKAVRNGTPTSDSDVGTPDRLDSSFTEAMTRSSLNESPVSEVMLLSPPVALQTLHEEEEAEAAEGGEAPLPPVPSVSSQVPSQVAETESSVELLVLHFDDCLVSPSDVQRVACEYVTALCDRILKSLSTSTPSSPSKSTPYLDRLSGRARVVIEEFVEAVENGSDVESTPSLPQFTFPSPHVQVDVETESDIDSTEPSCHAYQDSLTGRTRVIIEEVDIESADMMDAGSGSVTESVQGDSVSSVHVASHAGSEPILQPTVEPFIESIPTGESESLSEQHVALQRSLQVALQQVDFLNQQLNLVTTAAAQKENEMNREAEETRLGYEAVIRSLKADKKELTARLDTIVELRSQEKDSLADAESDLQVRVAELEQIRCELNQRLESLESNHKKEMEAERASMVQSQQEMELQYQEELQTMTDLYSSLQQQKVQDKRTFDSQEEQLRVELNQMQEANKELTQIVESYLNKITELTDSLKQKDEAFADIRREVEAKDKSIDVLHKQLAKSNQDGSEAQIKLESIMASAEKDMQEMSNYYESKLESVLNEREQLISNLKKEHDKSISMYVAKISNLAAQQQDQKIQNNQLKSELSELMNRLESLQEVVVELQDSKLKEKELMDRILQEALNHHESELAQLQEEKDRLGIVYKQTLFSLQNRDVELDQTRVDVVTRTFVSDLIGRAVRNSVHEDTTMSLESIQTVKQAMHQDMNRVVGSGCCQKLQELNHKLQVQLLSQRTVSSALLNCISLELTQQRSACLSHALESKNLRQSVEDMSTDNQRSEISHKQAVSALESALSTSKQEAAKLISDLRSELGHTEKELRAKDLQIIDLQAQLSRQLKSVDEMSCLLNQAEEEREKSVNASAEKVNILNRELSKYQEKMRESEKQRMELSNRIQSLQDEISRLTAHGEGSVSIEKLTVEQEQTVSVLRDTIAEQVQALSVAEARCAELGAELDQLRTAKDVQDPHSTEAQALEEQIGALQEEFTRLVESDRKLREQIVELEKEKALLEDNAEDMKSIIFGFQKDVETLRFELTEARTSSDKQLAPVLAVVNTLQTQLSLAQEEALQEKERLVTDYEERLMHKEALIADNRNSLSKILESYEVQLSGLKQSVESQYESKWTKEKEKQEKLFIENQLKQESIIEQLQQQLKDLSDRNSSLAEEISSNEKSMQVGLKELEYRDEQTESLQKEVQNLQSDKRRLDDLMNAMKREMDSNLILLEGVKEEAEQANAQATESRLKAEQAASDLQAMQQVISELETERDSFTESVTKDVNGFKQRIAELEKERDDLMLQLSRVNLNESIQSESVCEQDEDEDTVSQTSTIRSSHDVVPSESSIPSREHNKQVDESTSDLMSLVQYLESRCKQLDQELTQSKAQNERFTSQINSASIQGSAGEVAALKDRIQQIESQLEEERAKVKSYAQSFDMAKDGSDNDSNHELVLREQEHRAAQKDYETLIGQLEIRIGELTQKMAEEREAHAAARKAELERRDRLHKESMDRMVASKDEHFKRFESRFKRDLETRAQEFENDKNGLKSLIDELQQTCADLTAENIREREARLAVEEKERDMSSELIQLQKSLQEKTDQLTFMDRDRKEEKKRRTFLENESNQRQQECERLRNDLSDRIREYNDLVSAKTDSVEKCFALEAKEKALTNEIAMLEKSLAEALESTHQIKSQWENERNGLCQQLEKERIAKDDLSRELSRKTQLVEQLEVSLSQLQTHVEHESIQVADGIADAAVAEVDRQREEALAVRERNHAVEMLIQKEEREHLDRMIQELTGQVEDLTGQITSLTARCNGQEKEKEQVLNSNQMLSLSNSHLEEQLRTIESQVQELRQVKLLMAEELHQRDDRMEALREEIQSLKCQTEDQLVVAQNVNDSQIESYQRNQKELENHIHVLQTEADQKESTIVDLKRLIAQLEIAREDQKKPLMSKSGNGYRTDDELFESHHDLIQGRTFLAASLKLAEAEVASMEAGTDSRLDQTPTAFASLGSAADDRTSKHSTQVNVLPWSNENIEELYEIRMKELTQHRPGSAEKQIRESPKHFPAATTPRAASTQPRIDLVNQFQKNAKKAEETEINKLRKVLSSGYISPIRSSYVHTGFNETVEHEEEEVLGSPQQSNRLRSSSPSIRSPGHFMSESADASVVSHLKMEDLLNQTDNRLKQIQSRLNQFKTEPNQRGDSQPSRYSSSFRPAAVSSADVMTNARTVVQPVVQPVTATTTKHRSVSPVLTATQRLSGLDTRQLYLLRKQKERETLEIASKKEKVNLEQEQNISKKAAELMRDFQQSISTVREASPNRYTSPLRLLNKTEEVRVQSQTIRDRERERERTELGRLQQIFTGISTPRSPQSSLRKRGSDKTVAQLSPAARETSLASSWPVNRR